jgi:hypothetical protein
VVLSLLGADATPGSWKPLFSLPLFSTPACLYAATDTSILARCD